MVWYVGISYDEGCLVSLVLLGYALIGTGYGAVLPVRSDWFLNATA